MLGEIEIPTKRVVDRREEGGGGGGEKKNTPARSHCSFLLRGRTEFLIGAV